MWVIVGLGNPGRRYAKTRHNIGFMVADNLADRYGIELSTKELYAVGKGSAEGNIIVLVEPLTFMNRSGLAVREVLRRHSAKTRNLIVIHDDIDMEEGKLKIRKKGSSGGHKGIESVIRETGTSEFIRVKVGIGREEGVPAEDYVLRKFGKEEMLTMKHAIVRAADAVVMVIDEGVDNAMNEFN